MIYGYIFIFKRNPKNVFFSVFFLSDRKVPLGLWPMLESQPSAPRTHGEYLPQTLNPLQVRMFFNVFNGSLWVSFRFECFSLREIYVNI